MECTSSYRFYGSRVDHPLGCDYEAVHHCVRGMYAFARTRMAVTLLSLALITSLALGLVVSSPHHAFCHVHQLHTIGTLRCFQVAIRLERQRLREMT